MLIYHKHLIVLLALLLIPGTGRLGAQEEPVPVPSAEKAESPEKEEKNESKSTVEPQPGGRLPWEVPLVPPKLPGQKLKSVKEILQFLGIDASQWRNFYQDRPFDVGEEEYVNRVLARIHRVGRESLYAFRKTDWQPQQIIDSPHEHQGETFLLRGRAKQIKKVPLLAELLERYEFEHHYQITIDLADHEHEAIVCVTHLPKAWPQEGSIDEPIEVEGVFVKTSPQENKPTQFIFVANNIAWLPERIDLKHGITEEILLLSKQGFDASTLDEVRTRNLHDLTEGDREAFYEMLGAVEKIPANTPELTHAPHVDIGACLTSPEQQHGHFVSVLGTAKRIERIEIESSEIRTRFGLDHYFVLYIFVPLNEQRIKWSRTANDPHPRIFDNNFPVTVCVRTLPPGLKPAPKTREYVRVQGPILKIWAYKPQGEGSDLVQPSPMVLASTVHVVEAAKPAPSFWTNIVFGIMLLGLCGLLWAIFGQFRNDKPILSAAHREEKEVRFDSGSEKEGEL